MFPTGTVRDRVGSTTPPTRVQTGYAHGYVEPGSIAAVFGTITEAGSGFVACVVLAGGRRGPGAAAAAETRTASAAKATRCTTRTNVVRMAHLLATLGGLTACFFAGSWIVVATVGNQDHGWKGVLGGVFWYGFLLSAAVLVVAGLVVLARSRFGRAGTVTMLLVLAVGGAVAGVAAARGSSTQTITLVVPLAQVRAQDPQKPAPPSYFRETWAPNSRQVVRQDSVGFVNFGAGTFLGTITLRSGQIVYAATTSDQDNTTYAILGGTRTYSSARGTVTLHTIDNGHVGITIRLAS